MQEVIRELEARTLPQTGLPDCGQLAHVFSKIKVFPRAFGDTPPRTVSVIGSTRRVAC